MPNKRDDRADRNRAYFVEPRNFLRRGAVFTHTDADAIISRGPATCFVFTVRKFLSTGCHGGRGFRPIEGITFGFNPRARTNGKLTRAGTRYSLNNRIDSGHRVGNRFFGDR